MIPADKHAMLAGLQPPPTKTADRIGMTPADLRAARETLGLSQAAVAERLGIPRNTWHRWERGLLAVEKPEILRLALERLAQG